MDLRDVLQRGDVWRGDAFSRNGARNDARNETRNTSTLGGAVATGNAALDAQLAQGGWPRGALSELLFERPGIGELGLLLPALAELSQAGRWQAWINPPYLPYAPALSAAGIELSRLLLLRATDAREALWAAEQCLRSRVCGAVLIWPQAPDGRQLRRLQLAAEHGDALGLLFRPLTDAGQPSPATLRLGLCPSERGLSIEVLKQKGRFVSQHIVI